MKTETTKFLRSMTITFGVACLLSCQALLPGPSLDRDAIPQVVAVTTFDNRATGVNKEWEVDKGMADLLVAELVNVKCFTVVERRHFNAIKEEYENQKSKLFRAEGKTTEGRIRSAHYQIRGVITDFSQVSGGGLSILWRKLVFLGKGYTARVALTLTIVDIETGQIVTSVRCAGDAPASSLNLALEYKGVSFGGDSFFKTPLGEATQEALEEGVREIIKAMPKKTWRPMIASASGSAIIVNGGRDRKIRSGKKYAVHQPAKPLTDPDTGDVLEFIPGARLGTIKIAKVDRATAVAEILDGSGFERGQWLIPMDY